MGIILFIISYLVLIPINDMFYVSDDPQGIFTVESADGCVAKRKSWIVENNTLGQKG